MKRPGRGSLPGHARVGEYMNLIMSELACFWLGSLECPTPPGVGKRPASPSSNLGVRGLAHPQAGSHGACLQPLRCSSPAHLDYLNSIRVTIWRSVLGL